MNDTIDWLTEWGWKSDSCLPISAYVHIPFCRHRCGYCNFSLLANRDDLFDRFLNAIETEIAGLESPRSVKTLFLGGGTPSILPPQSMDRILKLLRKWLPLETDGEWSIEANPLDITESFCDQITNAGINRISIGGQSFQPAKLKILERDHSPEQLSCAIKIALSYFDSVSLDLIFGAPTETLSQWQSDLAITIDSGVHHLSTYGLTFEKGSRFWGMRERRAIESLSEELELEFYVSAMDRLTVAGFDHYEVSSFAKPEHRCQHNQSYWRGDPWWAFGPSAARYVAGTRSVNHKGTLEYIRRIEKGRSPVDEIERLSFEQQLRERFVFGLRQLNGVHWADMLVDANAWKLGQSTIRSIEQAMKKHVDLGWLVREGDQVRLTRSGLVISDSLWKEYL